MEMMNPRLQQFIDKDEDKQQEIWDKAVKLYHEKHSIDALKTLATYLDPEAKIYYENDKYKFELTQGAITIYCRIAQNTFYAYLNVLKVEYPDPIVFRRLLNLNATEFNQCKASIVKDNIRLTTETLLELSSPSKIFWDLHELATHGDKLDDVLSLYSQGVKEIHQPERTWDEEQIACGLKFSRKWINEALEKAQFWYEKNDLYAASWWLIGRLFSVMYFVHPEGKLYEEMNDIVEDYNNQERTQEDNIKRVILRLRKIRDMSDEELHENFFDVKRTFQTLKPASAELVNKYMEASLSSADRFKSLGHKDAEYMSLIYGIGLLINNFAMDSEFTEEMAQVYELAHIDYMNEMNPSILKKRFQEKDLSPKEKFQRLYNRPKNPTKMDLQNEKDRQTIIKRVRNFYDRVLSGEI